MNSGRRLLCIAALVHAVPRVSMVHASPRPRLAVFGLGGAGSNVIKAARAGQLLPAGVFAATVNASAAGQGADIVLPRGSVGSVASDEAPVAARLSSYAHVMLVAALAGHTGMDLLRDFAQVARRAGVPSSAVVIAPFDFERWNTRDGAASVTHFVDQVTVVSNQHLLHDLPPHASWSVCLRHVNERVAAVIGEQLMGAIYDACPRA